VNHPDLVDRVILEVCTSAGWEKCPNGEDVAEGPGMALYLPGGMHGTGVAGVVHQVAPDADLIVITVMGSTVESPGTATRAYQWVIDNAEKYGIDALVMSYGSSVSPRSNRRAGCPDPDGERGLFKAIRELGVVPVVASGNEGLLTSIGSPACFETAVSVGWVNEIGMIHEGSNVSEKLTLLAPSELAAATILDFGLYSAFGGTSGAAPVIGGLVAIARQVRPELTVDEFVAVARETGYPIDDYEVEGLPLIDFLALVETLAGFSLTPKPSLDASVDGTMLLIRGNAIKNSEFCEAAGFSFDCSDLKGSVQKWIANHTIISGGKICSFDGFEFKIGEIGTCLVQFRWEPWDAQNQKATGLGEKRLILVTGRELDSSEIDAVFSEKIGFIFHSNMVGSYSDIDISKRSSSGFSIIQGEGDVCVHTGEYNQEILTVGVGTCIVKMSFTEIISYEPYETGPWIHHFFRIDVE
ncbi:MAG: S8 family peptidase, partial [Tepidiformaceae bacterium]